MKKSLIVLFIFSTLAFSANVEFKEGWNLVGFPIAQKTKVNELIPLEKVEKIYALNSKEWTTKVDYFESYKGYWINFNSDVIITGIDDIGDILNDISTPKLSETVEPVDNWQF